jgi:hypothetical protein
VAKTPCVTKADLARQQKPSRLEKRQVPFDGLVGELLWLARLTRPDLAQAVSKIAQMVTAPGTEGYRRAVKILRYLAGTAKKGIFYSKTGNKHPYGYVDSDWAGDTNDRKSQTGYVVYLAGAPIIWKSVKQSVCAMSSTEAELVAAVEICKEALWLSHLMQEVGLTSTQITIRAFEDNDGAIANSRNGFTGRAVKHMELRYHFLSDQNKLGTFVLIPISTKKNVADIFTKGVDRETFERHAAKLVCEPPTGTGGRQD